MSKLITRLRRSLAELIRPEERAAAPAPQPPRPLRAAAAKTPDPRQEFLASLKTLVGEVGHGSLHAGRVNLIGLDRIKERYGADWERIAERADRIARNTIDRHLAPGDIYSAWHGTNYVIVFASLSLDQAQLKCVMIGDEIARILLGEQGGESIEVKTAVARVDGAIELADIPSLETLLKKSALLPVDTAAEPGGTGAAAAAGDAAGQRALSRLVEELEVLPVEAAANVKRDVLGEIRFAYRPVWNSTRNALVAYACVALVPTSDLGSVYEEAEFVLGSDIEETARLDGLVQEQILSELKRPAQAHRALLMLPVHFETLAAATRRRQYVQRLGDAVTAELAKWLLIDLIGVPDGVPQSRLMELLGALRKHCRGVLCRVRLESSDFAAFKALGVPVVGCNIAAHPASEFIIMQHMARFSRAAEKAGVEASVHGIRSLSLLSAALGAGFHYIDGDGVAKLLGQPGPVRAFHLADAYRPLVKA